MKTALLFVTVLLSNNHLFGCEIIEPSSVYNYEKAQLLQFNLTEDHRYLSTDLPDSPALTKLRNQVRSFTDPNPYKLLTKQRDLFFRAFGDWAVKAFDMIIKKKTSMITDIRCLEASLLHHHLSKKDPQTEFQAFILTKSYKVQIYMLSGNSESPPEIKWVKPYLKAAMLSGYKMQSHVHNHYFSLNTPTGDIAGTVIPSGTVDGYGDLGFYKRLASEYGLQYAWITNGFSTAVYTIKELERLNPEL